ncbi:MAG: thioredoxin domain-containing protein [Alphaproteobacteria bacterium]|nr:thioredoxin domain-containing protein [Alphaproteobacteria bacterium]
MNRMTALAAIAVGAAFAGLAFSGFTRGVAQQDAPISDEFSADQEAAIRAIVADYIARNPEAVIDALNAYSAAEDAREAERMSAAQKDALPYLASDDGAYVAGADIGAAKVAVIEFFDYHCSFCKRANGLVRELTADDPSVKVVFREFPILKEESELAARYALAAREQGKYLEMHFAMMDERGTITEARAIELAAELGLDADRLKRDAGDAKLRKALARNYGVAKDIGVDGTPGFLIAALDGSFIQLVPGFRPDEIKSAIVDAKKSAS